MLIVQSAALEMPHCAIKCNSWVQNLTSDMTENIADMTNIYNINYKSKYLSNKTL